MLELLGKPGGKVFDVLLAQLLIGRREHNHRVYEP
jgi:hypothetical protein